MQARVGSYYKCFGTNSNGESCQREFPSWRGLTCHKAKNHRCRVAQFEYFQAMAPTLDKADIFAGGGVVVHGTGKLQGEGKAHSMLLMNCTTLVETCPDRVQMCTVHDQYKDSTHLFWLDAR